MITLPPFLRRRVSIAVGVASILVFSGCALIDRDTSRHQSTSVVAFLYPGENQPFVAPSLPTLRLPLRVGIAFAPSSPGHSDQMSEMQRSTLLRQVAAEFRKLPFVESIDLVPATYLRAGGGFANLDQLRGLLGIDVIALVAFDQVQATTETPWSLSYWTIVGAYVVPAQKNDTHTLMEAVVYDIASRKLLFHAPGVSALKGHSTLIRTADELRTDANRGMGEATTDLITNLRRELELFQVRAREEPDTIRIEHKPSYRGGGSWGAVAGGVWLLALGVRLLRSRE